MRLATIILAMGLAHFPALGGTSEWTVEPPLPRAVAGSNLFICECTLECAGLDFHLSLEELREHRDDLDCGRLVLTHLGDAMSRLRGQIELETADDGFSVKL